MAKDREYPSYLTCVAEVLSNSPTPLSIDTLVSRIAKKRPVGSGTRSAVYQAIGKLYQAIPVGSGRFGWLSCLLRDQYFRHPLTRGEIRKGTLLLDELEHAVFFPQFFQAHRPDTRLISVELMGGPTLQVHAEIERGTWALRLGKAFGEWVDQAGGTTEDDLLIHVKDAVSGEYGMRLQPKESRQEGLDSETQRGPIAGCGADYRQGQKNTASDAGVGVGRRPDRAERVQRRDSAGRYALRVARVQQFAPDRRGRIYD